MHSLLVTVAFFLALLLAGPGFGGEAAAVLDLEKHVATDRRASRPRETARTSGRCRTRPARRSISIWRR